jgi:hypothetical protein
MRSAKGALAAVVGVVSCLPILVAIAALTVVHHITLRVIMRRKD